MPKILTRLTNQLKAKGVANASAVASSQLQKFGIMKGGALTKKGAVRNSMTPGERAKDRAAKYSTGHSTKDYSYNAKTNMATLKKKGK